MSDKVSLDFVAWMVSDFRLKDVRVILDVRETVALTSDQADTLADHLRDLAAEARRREPSDEGSF